MQKPSTQIKRKVSKTTGVPTTKSGQKRKAQKAATGGGCLISVILVFTIIVSMITVGCSFKNSKYGQIETNAVKKIISSIDDYLDYKISEKELKSEVKEIQSRLDANRNSTNYKSSKTTDEIVSDLDSATLSITLSRLSIVLSNITHTDSDILEIRNELADDIGQSKR